MKHQKFSFTSAEQLLSQLNADGLQLPLCDNITLLANPVMLGRHNIPNRLVSQPVEGFDAIGDGAPGSRTFDRYTQLAQGMSGMIWMESISISSDGRSNPAQLWLNEKNVGEFAKLVELMHTASECRPYVVAQLTHSGRFSSPNGNPQPICAQHNSFIPKDNEKIVTDSELAQLAEDYQKAAMLAQLAGFDAVDIRCCHGYLLNELLGARDREGCYGGSLQNRARLLLEIVDRVCAAVDIEVAVRLNMFDAVPFPFGFGMSGAEVEQPSAEEPIWLLRELTKHGVRLLNISAGIGAYSPQVIRPSDSGGAVYLTESPLQGVCRMVSLARLAKENVPDALVVGSAFSWLRQMAPQAAAGCIERGWMDFAGFGRLPICYPEYAKDILSGEGLVPEQCCITCNGCMAWIKSTGKPLRCIQKERMIKNAND